MLANAVRSRVGLIVNLLYLSIGKNYTSTYIYRIVQK
jgi:hypothetical protein